MTAIKDTRLWQFKVDPSVPTGYVKHLFASRAAVPAGEVWYDSAPEALAGGKATAPEPETEKPFEQLSVAEQVAALEALGNDERAELDAEDLAVLKEAADADLASIAADKPKRGRKPKAQ